MTVLFKPVLIETAEQAEALPEGTPVLTILTDPGEEPRVIGADYIDDGFDEDLTPGSNFHHVALVPIEAEEETRGGPIDGDWDWDNGPVSPPPPTPATRLVTPWEPA